jgi:uncharacterized protein YggE
MRCLCLTVLFLASVSAVFGQLESDTLTIQSSRSVNLPPDQLVFYVSVNSSLDATLDQVVASLQGSGIAATDLSGVFSSPEPGLPTTNPGLLWSFTLGVPLTRLKGTVASLTTLQTSMAKNNGAALMFQVQGSRVSAELAQAQSCSLQSLVADAQAQAHKLAVAAGLFAGPILAISDGSSEGLYSPIQYSVSGSPAFIGTVSLVSTTALIVQRISTPTQFACSVDVKFKLLH